jgi:hypothetical protein
MRALLYETRRGLAGRIVLLQSTNANSVRFFVVQILNPTAGVALNKFILADLHRAWGI